MKKPTLLLSSRTANNHSTSIIRKVAEKKRSETTPVVEGTDNLWAVKMLDSEKDVRIFRHKMSKRIDANSQSLAAVRTRIKEEKKGNADISTTIFELELANGFMKIKLEDYKNSDKENWGIFKKEFSKEMDLWNIEFADFTSTI